MKAFAYTALPSKVVFGSGTIANVGDELAGLGCQRALILSTPDQRAMAEGLRDRLGDAAVGIFDGAAMHTPVDVTARAVKAATSLAADCTIAVGGGSTIGLGKAVALHTDLPQLVIPTTYAGSEATPILGQTEDGVKTTQRSMKVLPEVILYDVDQTLTLPVGLSMTSGLNAIAHAVEGLYSKDANPFISLIAEDGVRALASALPGIMENPLDLVSRSDALYGAWACGTTLGAVGMALHHKLCHVLGGTFDLPHAETHSVVLPHAMAYNASATTDAMARVARALGVDDAPLGVWNLAKRLGVPTSLAEIGMPRDGIDRALELTLANPYWNPVPLEASRLRRLLENAFDGCAPAA